MIPEDSSLYEFVDSFCCRSNEVDIIRSEETSSSSLASHLHPRRTDSLPSLVHSSFSSSSSLELSISSKLSAPDPHSNLCENNSVPTKDSDTFYTTIDRNPFIISRCKLKEPGEKVVVCFDYSDTEKSQDDPRDVGNYLQKFMSDHKTFAGSHDTYDSLSTMDYEHREH